MLVNVSISLLECSALGIRETVLLELRRDGRPSELLIIGGFSLGRRYVADGLMWPEVTKPVDSSEPGHLDDLQVTPRPRR